MDDRDCPVDLAVQSDSIPISVLGEGVGGVQLCPGLVIGAPVALPGAAKHIYSRLAANSAELDQGMPDLIICLSSDGNQLSDKYLHNIESALSPIVSGCGVWFFSSGEHSDPLARAVSSTIKDVLPQTDQTVEVLHIILNSLSRISMASGGEVAPMVDTSLNTLLLLSRREVDEPRQLARFRALAAVRLAHPPPALLIGVPSEGFSSGLSSPAPPILLSPSNDKKPLPAVIFAGASQWSLDELLVYVESGLPVIVLQDSCELCMLLHSAALIYRIPQFDHYQFEKWLKAESTLLSIGDPMAVCQLIIKIFSIAMGDVQLLDFISSEEMISLPTRLLSQCCDCAVGAVERRQVLNTAARLNLPELLPAIDLEEALDGELMTCILCETASHDDRVDFLAAVLEHHPQIAITSELLIRMLKSTDQHFFSSIVLCQCLGYSSMPEDVDDQLARHMDKLMQRLSFGVEGLFPPSILTGDLFHKDSAAAIRMLAIWCLVLHRPAMVKCLCAFSDEPMAFSLVLSRIARSLAHESHDWFFYEESLTQLANSLSSSAVSLLDSVHKKTPIKAYQLLCQPLESFNGSTITQLAFQSNSRALLSHECCQKWVHRLLHGHLQARNSPWFLPRWIKILLAALLVVPIRWWISTRPSSISQPLATSHRSPTVALLDSERLPKRQRAVSTYSVISGRSDALTAMTAPMSANFAMNLGGAESATPQSMVFPLNIEDVDPDMIPRTPRKSDVRRTNLQNDGNISASNSYNSDSRIRRWSPPSIGVFYSTPIVKYWLALVFRVLHIALLAYSVVLPGCGAAPLDAVVWAWSFISWIESLWVLSVRAQTTPLSLMPWRVFDTIMTAAFLLLMLMFKLFGDALWNYSMIHTSAYPGRVISACFLLYLCYSTLFFYVSLSDIYGPLMIRVKLMILRDFTNFLIMIALVMASSAAAMQAVLYPDRELSFASVKSALSWVWLSLFTTDLSGLKESDTCRKTFLGEPKDYCRSLGRYSNPTCPAQSYTAYIIIIQYFILLKLILWPILFAFFAKTAKAVEEEADRIWKFQMYSLVADFSIRPALPPPLTPLYFLCIVCCRARGAINRVFCYGSVDHPDMDSHKSRSTTRFGSVYRNPSVPFKRNDFMNAFWKHLAIDHWKEEQPKKEKTEGSGELRDIKEQLRMMSLRAGYKKCGEEPKAEVPVPIKYYENINRMPPRLVDRSWSVLLPRYSPPFYCQPAEEFPMEVAKHVEVATQANVCELRRAWRGRQVQDHVAGRGWTLSSAGYPLNPNGRRGIAGRGCHVRFGSNRRLFYVILSGLTKSEAKVLTDSNGNLPNESGVDTGSRDENLANILRTIGMTEADAQAFSLRRLDTSLAGPSELVGVIDSSPAHIDTLTVEDEKDTDNAWTEHDVWAMSLRTRKVTSSLGYAWKSVNSSHLPPEQIQMLSKTMAVYGIN